MKIRYYLSLIALLAGALRATAQQEVLRPLLGDRMRVQTAAAPSGKTTQTTNLKKLPFQDDFSFYEGRPKDTIWQYGGGAYVNHTYSTSPPTVGLCTLDGLDYSGRPYDTSFNTLAYGPGDTLRSDSIDLSGLNTNSGVVLSFFYEAGGVGDAPDPGDSLILEFYNPLASTNPWEIVWSADGTSAKTKWKYVAVPVNKLNYLNNGFQFRFRNWASTFGDYDHWNIDYVRVDKNRSIADTILNDFLFYQIPRTQLKGYFEVPYNHFAANPSYYLNDTVAVGVQNNSLIPVLGTYKYTRSIDNVAYQSPTFVTLNLPPLARKIFPLAVLPFDSSAQQITQPCELKHTYLLQGAGFDKNEKNLNNNIVVTNHLYNYFAYDDGSAEFAYGLNVSGGKIAMQFTLLMPDTLRSVDMFFARLNEDVSKELFVLNVWQQIQPVESTPLATLEFQKPRYSNWRNGFANYAFPNPVALPAGTYYIGWQQDGNKLLNLGVDANDTATQHMFVNYTGTWANSTIPGAWMIHPQFGSVVPSRVSPALPATHASITAYPNPAEDRITFKPEAGDKLLNGRIFNALGQQILQFANPDVNIAQFAPGIYYVHITTQKGIATLSFSKQ